MDDVARRIFGAYGITDASIQNPQSGYRNTSYATTLANGSPVNIIIYKNETGIKDRIKRANKVGDYLSSRNFPARNTYDNRILKISSPSGERYASLYHYLPGETIPWEAYTKHHIKILGMAMAHMHNKLELFQTEGTASVEDEYISHTRRMKDYFQERGVQNAMHDKLKLQSYDTDLFDDFEKLLGALKSLPGRQTLHMDFVRGNILFGTAKTNTALSDGPISLTGVIDFEKVSIGHPIFDIARTLSFLLVDCKYKPSEKVSKYFLHSGYAKRGGLKVPNIKCKENDVLDSLSTLFLVYDFYKFLKHNPYESLSANEHYLRTRDILIARKVLRNI